MQLIVADDHPMIQKGLSYILKELYADFHLTTVYDGEKLYQALRNTVFDLLILDINMPSMSFQQYEDIAVRYPHLKVLIYSQNPEKEFAPRYIKAGAKGYIEKSSSDEELVKAIKKIMGGGNYWTEDVMNIMMDQFRGNKSGNPFHNLSNREYDVALQLLYGKNLNEIGSELNLSPSTVSTYKVRLFEKLNVDNSVSFFRLAKDYGVI